MKKIELLSPVGDESSLYQAIHNGADAIYLGGENYGARKFAKNFSRDMLKEAIEYSHLYGVKVYVTVNTVIFDNEMDEFLEYIKFLYESNVDAVIMQDIGAIRRVKDEFPDIEIHASTQMHNHNEEGIKLLESLGVNRVVFARELSLDEINNIKTSLEKEVFIHGALCISYSGCCLFSSITNNRSGNRGECVASCRLPYRLKQDDKIIDTLGNYILSTKELNTINNIDKLISSGIDSLKIEGRMKSPEYVGFVTRLYRRAIDNYYKGNKFLLDEDSLKKLKTLYNREYTNGFLFNDYGSKLMNIKSPNHQGLQIGKVIYVDKHKIKIHLSEDLNQEDGIRFAINNTGMMVNKLYNEKGLLINSVKKGNIAVLDNKIGLKDKSTVNKTIDKILNEELRKIKEKKIGIDVSVVASLSKGLEISFSDGQTRIKKSSLCVFPSINKPLVKTDIEKQVNRLGNTPFVINNVNIEMDDNIFISNKDINSLRREVSEDLINFRKNNKIYNKINKSQNLEKRILKKEKNNINVLVRTEEQVKACIDCKTDNIYITDYSLYKKYKSNNTYYALPRVNTRYIPFDNENLLVREIGAIGKYNNTNNLIGDYTLNACNLDSVKVLTDLGLNRICVSPEIDINNFLENDYNNEIVVYGRLELMITKYCIMNMVLNNDLKKCNLCFKNKYSLVDDKGRVYPMLHDRHLTTIFDCKNINLFSDICRLRDKFNNFRIDLFDEDYIKTKELIEKCRQML